LLLCAIVHPADGADRDGGVRLASTPAGMHPTWAKRFADGGRQRARFRKGLANFLPDLAIEIVRRPDHAKGFVALPRR
jgi:putative transposase